METDTQTPPNPDFTMRARLSDEYNGKNVLDTLETLALNYVTDSYGFVCVTHTLEYLVRKHGPPTDPYHLISRFPSASVSDRQAAVLACLEYDCVSASERRVLLLHAQYMGFSDISQALIDNGGQIYYVDDDGQVMLSGMKIGKDGPYSVLCPEVTTTLAGRQVILKYILKNHRSFPKLVINSIIVSLGMFTADQVPAEMIPDFAALISTFYETYPGKVIQCVPVDDALREVLLLRYGILYDAALHNVFHQQFKTDSRRLAKLESVSKMLAGITGQASSSEPLSA